MFFNKKNNINKRTNKYKNIKIYNTFNFKKKSYFNKHKIIYTIIGILTLGIITFTIYFLFFSNFFNIQKIIIETEKTASLNKDDIEVSLSNFLSKNILFTSEKEIINNIKSLYPTINEIVIKKIFPNKIRLKIYEYQEVAIVILKDKGNFIINEQGLIVSNDITKAKDLLKIYLDTDIEPQIYKTIINPNDLIFIFKQLKPISTTLNTTIKHVYYNKISKELKFKLNNDWVLRFEIYQNIEKALSELILALEKIDKNNISEIDLRIPGKIFVKNKT